MFLQFLDSQKIKLKTLACSFEITHNFQNLSSNPLQMPQSGNFYTEKCLQEAACDSVKSYQKPPVSALENIDQTQRREFWGWFQQAFSKLVSNF